MILLVTALCSQGFYHLDEHFQLLEFAGYKLGLSPASDLPWEFAAEIRNGLQPAIATAVIGTLRALGLTDPFIAATVLRVLSGGLAFVIYRRFARRIGATLGQHTGRTTLLALSLLWFMPFLSVRFSSENWSSLALVGALTLLPLVVTDGERTPREYLVAGFLLGLAIDFRFQAGFAVVGLGAWLLARRRIRTRSLGVMILGGLAALSIGALGDRWLYGHFVFTPWTYFSSNIIEGKAATFGVSPWWYYLPRVTVALIPPISLALLGCFAAGWWRQRDTAIVWLLTAFVAAHALVAHKELRFLFPVVVPFVALVAAGWDALKPTGRWPGRMAVSLGVMNTLALCWVATRPAQQFVAGLSAIYHERIAHDGVLYAERESPYHMGALRPNFYEPPSLRVVSVPSLDSLRGSGMSLQPGDLLLQRHAVASPDISPLHAVRVFRGFPAWVLRFNVGHWVSRTEIWSVYRVTE